MASPNLWDFLPPALTPVQGNYVTRKVFQWIACDPSVEHRCKACATRCKAEVGSDAALLLAIRLRALIAEHGLAAESHGFYFELFTDDMGEVDWAELARHYLTVIAKVQ